MAKEVGWLVVSCAAVRTFFHQTMPQNPQKWEEIPPAVTTLTTWWFILGQFNLLFSTAKNYATFVFVKCSDTLLCCRCSTNVRGVEKNMRKLGSTSSSVYNK